MTRADQLKRAYSLAPHPEGGSFSECYTAPFRDAAGRPLMGSIYFLLERDEISHLHVIDCDELWYFHEGCGLAVTAIYKDGAVERLLLGGDETAGQRAMCLLPAETVFAAENVDPNGYSFVSCATTPKFTYDAFRLIAKEELRALCPARYEELARLAMNDPAKAAR